MHLARISTVAATRKNALQSLVWCNQAILDRDKSTGVPDVCGIA